MKKKEIMKKIGTIDQLSYVRKVVYTDGKCAHMKVLEVKSGDISFSLAEDKCLDMLELSYRGKPIHYLSKSGIQNVQHYDNQESEAARSMMGGMFFTCGIDNVGTAVSENGRNYPMHGKLRSTPAEKVCADAYWNEDEYRVKISGEIHLGELFGEDIILRRRIETVLGSKKIRIQDEYENQGFREEPFMLLYHFNVGYPLIDEGSEVIIPSVSTILRGEEKETDRGWRRVEAPRDLLPEEVFYHKFNQEKESKVFAKLYNDKLNLGFKVSFDLKQLPYLTQWKSMASGDYVMGLEPCNCHVQGRAWERKNGTLQMIAPFEKKVVDLEIEIMESRV